MFLSPGPGLAFSKESVHNELGSFADFFKIVVCDLAGGNTVEVRHFDECKDESGVSDLVFCLWVFVTILVIEVGCELVSLDLNFDRLTSVPSEDIVNTLIRCVDN